MSPPLETIDTKVKKKKLLFVKATSQTDTLPVNANFYDVEELSIDLSTDPSAQEEIIPRILELKPDILIIKIVKDPKQYPLLKVLGDTLTQCPVVCLVSKVESQDLQILYERYKINQVMVWPLDDQQLFCQIESAYYHWMTSKKLMKKAKTASHTAKIAMESAAELGAAIRLMETLNSVRDFDSLAKQVTQVFAGFDLQIAMKMRATQDNLYYPSSIDDITKEILEDASQREVRIISKKRLMLMKTDYLVLLITNAPWQDDERYGRYRDLLAYIVTLTDSKIRALSVDSLIERQHQKVAQIAQMIQAQSVQSHDRVLAVMRHLYQDLELAALSLDLTLEEEKHLLSLSEQALDSLVKFSEFNVLIESHFENLLQSFENISRLANFSPENPSKSNQGDEFELF